MRVRECMIMLWFNHSSILQLNTLEQYCLGQSTAKHHKTSFLLSYRWNYNISWFILNKYSEFQHFLALYFFLKGNFKRQAFFFKCECSSLFTISSNVGKKVERDNMLWVISWAKKKVNFLFCAEVFWYK